FPSARMDDDLVCPGDLGTLRVVYSFLAPLSGRLTDGVDKLRDLPQGSAVLGVVGQQLVFPARVPRLLPTCPPHQALEASGVLGCPSAPQVAANVLEPVGEGGEVDVGVDDGQDVHGVGEQAVH